ncbi:uncharacterized protein [Palaemon carinicauda]|uniref:uncharacterized protein n=1 Tax=Palaemon carinicauda TaxID=392227 RepID=UPI0035B59919
MKTAVLLASMIILLSMEVRAARFSDDDNLFDVLADDAISSNSNNKKNNSINGIRNSNKNNSNNGIRNNNKNNSDRNDLDNGNDIGNVFTNSNDNGNGSSDADNESMTDTSGGLSFNSLFSNVGTTIFTVTGVSILATLLLMLLMGYDFGSLLGRLDNNFGASSFIAPNYPYDEGLDNYPPPVILARRSYAALTPVIEAITSAYKKYQGKY